MTAAGICPLDRLVRLSAAHDHAREALCRGVEEELPLGTIIEATLGNARIRGEVTGYGSTWSCHSAGCVWVRNTRTGKTRRVYPALDTEAVRVVMKPNNS